MLKNFMFSSRTQFLMAAIVAIGLSALVFSLISLGGKTDGKKSAEAASMPIIAAQAPINNSLNHEELALSRLGLWTQSDMSSWASRTREGGEYLFKSVTLKYPTHDVFIDQLNVINPNVSEVGLPVFSDFIATHIDIVSRVDWTATKMAELTAKPTQHDVLRQLSVSTDAPKFENLISYFLFMTDLPDGSSGLDLTIKDYDYKLNVITRTNVNENRQREGGLSDNDERAAALSIMEQDRHAYQNVSEEEARRRSVEDAGDMETVPAAASSDLTRLATARATGSATSLSAMAFSHLAFEQLPSGEKTINFENLLLIETAAEQIELSHSLAEAEFLVRNGVSVGDLLSSGLGGVSNQLMDVRNNVFKAVSVRQFESVSGAVLMQAPLILITSGQGRGERLRKSIQVDRVLFTRHADDKPTDFQSNTASLRSIPFELYGYNAPILSFSARSEFNADGKEMIIESLQLAMADAFEINIIGQGQNLLGAPVLNLIPSFLPGLNLPENQDVVISSLHLGLENKGLAGAIFDQADDMRVMNLEADKGLGALTKNFFDFRNIDLRTPVQKALITDIVNAANNVSGSSGSIDLRLKPNEDMSLSEIAKISQFLSRPVPMIVQRQDLQYPEDVIENVSAEEIAEMEFYLTPVTKTDYYDPEMEALSEALDQYVRNDLPLNDQQQADLVLVNKYWERQGQFLSVQEQYIIEHEKIMAEDGSIVDMNPLGSSNSFSESRVNPDVTRLIYLKDSEFVDGLIQQLNISLSSTP